MKKIRRLSKKIKSGKRVNPPLTRESEFLSLFPHRYDFIEADYPANPDDRPEWRTEDRFPLTDRKILAGGKLYGVRPGETTDYVLLDIDTQSVHYPSRDALAVGRIVDALEPLGLTDYIAVQSSYRGGLHLYFPFDGDGKPSHAIGTAVTQVLRDAGIRVALGHLEVFPNPKTYNPDRVTLYNAHRLPLQQGSYLLNEQWETIYSHPANFVERWKFAKRRNVIDEGLYARVLEVAKRTTYPFTGSALDYLTDLNTKIEAGWSGPGQTNELLRWIGTRTYVFGHLLHDCEPLEGPALVNQMMAIAKSLPGYEEHCNHRHDLEKRCWDWARAIQESHFHYGRESLPKPIDPLLAIDFDLSWNQWEETRVRERIQDAINGLSQQGLYPDPITQRRDAIEQFEFEDGRHVSRRSLYRHKDLWHPHHQTAQELEPASVATLEEVYPIPENLENEPIAETLKPLQGKEVYPVPLNELMGACEGVVARAPSEQRAQTTPSHSTSEVRGGGGGGDIPELRGDIRVPPWMTGVAALEFAIEMQCLRLQWTASRLEQYAIECHGIPMVFMNQWDLDCLLNDLARQELPGAPVGN